MPPILLSQYALETPQGDLPHTIAALNAGESALIPGPSFGLPVPSAPFRDPSCRSLSGAITALKTSIDLPDPASSVFIYCAAKGDLSGFATPAFAESAPAETVSARLDEQAAAILDILDWHPARSLVVSCACASGAVALEVAKELLDEGTYAHAVVYGHDPLSGFVVHGFNSLGALSPTGARPFDAARNGLTLGECAALAVLSRGDAAPGNIVLAGCGTSNDANHRTGPSRDGAGLARAIAAALADGKLDPAAIGAVKCHGTATPYNDAMEAKALTLIFGTAIPPMVSTKGALGHMSGAGSLCEALLAAAFLKQRTIPPTCCYSERGVEEVVPVSAAPQQIDTHHILCLSAGFGGLNAALILTEAQ